MNRVSLAIAALFAVGFAFAAEADNSAALPKQNLVETAKVKYLRGPMKFDRAAKKLVFENADTNANAFLTLDVPLRRGSTYEFGATISTDGLSRNLCFCLEWYGKKGFIAGTYAPNVSGTTNALALAMRSRPIPPEATHAALQVIAGKGTLGKAVVENLFLREKEMPLIDGLYTSRYRNFAADGRVVIKAALTLPEGFCKTAKGVFRVIDAKKPSVARSIPVSVTDYVAETECKVSDFAMGANRIEFVLSDVPGRTNETAAIVFNRVTREREQSIKVRFDEYGRTLVDGKLFFPLGMYLMGRFDDKKFERFCDSPFNCYMDYDRPTRERMDLSAKKGMKVIYNTVGKILPEAALVREFRDHPATLAWYMNDERPVSERAAMKAERELVEKLDPNHPGWIAIWQHSEVRDYLPVFDAIGTDPYPLYKDPIGMVTEWVRDTERGTMDLKPIWEVVQVFDKDAYSWRKPGPPRSECGAPTYDEVRNMAWQALAGGAKGLIFYSFFDLVKMDRKDPFERRWDEVKRIAAEIKGYVPFFHSLEKGPSVSVDDERIAVRAWRNDGRILLALVNTVREPVTCKVTLDGKPETVTLAPIEVRLR